MTTAPMLSSGGEATPHGSFAAPVAAVVSAREREVLLEIARGRSNAEIAQALFIGVETVKIHVAEILRKLGLRDRIQAVVFAYENGLVSPRE